MNGPIVTTQPTGKSRITLTVRFEDIKVTLAVGSHRLLRTRFYGGDVAFVGVDASGRALVRPATPMEMIEHLVEGDIGG